MQCLICGKDSAGEVCNQCIRAEQGIYAKDWTYKEGLIVKKTEDFRVNVTNARVNGIAVISTSPNGMNAKIDNFNHYIEEETHVLAFKSAKDVLKHLKYTGVNALDSNGWTKADMLKFEAGYSTICSTSPTLTYNPLYIRIIKK